MTIDYQKVLDTDVSFLTKYYYKKVGHIKNSFLTDVPQIEHYKLLTYLSFQFNNALLIDAGTLHGISALCLSQNPTNRVISYDTEPRVIDSTVQYRPFKRQNIEFRHMGIEQEEKEVLLGSSLIFMDIGHTGVEEKMVTDLLTKNKWNGYMVADDILRFPELAKWFTDVKAKKYDITPIGHVSGTGLLDFSGRGVRISTTKHNSVKLDKLALKYGTDKASAVHNYTPIYERYFETVRSEPLRILEIGIQSGASHRMWREYFPNAEIIGFDKDEHFLQKEGIITVKGTQSSKKHLEQLARIFAPFDIIIDDGSHINKDLLLTFETLFVALKPGGLYVAEDLHTCYWGHGFGRPIFIKRLKKLIDQVNSGGKSGVADREKDSPLGFMRSPVDWWEKSVEFAHFYRGIVFIKKL